MISGTIHNAGKILEMTWEWEQKKSSGNILKKDALEISPEQSQLQMYREQLEKNREGNEYSAIYAKIQSGKELSPSEEDMLRAKDPKLYMEYKADRMEQKAYEKRLKNCKTKEEAESLHINRLNGKLSELKSIVNNPNIPKSEKVKEAQRILGDTTKTVQVFHTFVKSVEFKELPNENDVTEAKGTENEISEEKIDCESGVSTDVESDKVIDNLADTEKQILKEMFGLEEKHFKDIKKPMQIDVLL